VSAPAECVFTTDEWQSHHTEKMADSGLGLYYLDITLAAANMVEFTFYWPSDTKWENINYRLDRRADLAH
jgi:glucoamylase